MSAPSPYGCRALALALCAAPAAIVGAIFGLAELIAHTCNPFA